MRTAIDAVRQDAVLGPAAIWLQDKLKIRWSLACVTVIAPGDTNSTEEHASETQVHRSHLVGVERGAQVDG